MNDLYQKLMSHREEILALAGKHGARNVRVFGSVARGDALPDSDIDLLVDMEPSRGLFEFVEFCDEVEKALGHPVDVVTEGGVSRYIRPAVLREARSL